MKRRLLFMSVVASAFVACLWTLPAAASPAPSGERIVGGTASGGGTVIEPVYDDMTGQIRYVSTPRGAPNPVKSNPRASAPFYLPVYPASSTIGTDGVVTLNCQDTTATTTENCPDHGPAVAGLAQLFEPTVYSTSAGAVAGHDHLMAGPGSGGDFNVAWVPTLILFTYSATTYPHITTLDQLTSLLKSGAVIEIPLDGTPFNRVPLPNLTFHCSVVSAAVYAQGVPFTG
jgi:hypothetical protein